MDWPIASTIISVSVVIVGGLVSIFRKPKSEECDKHTTAIAEIDKRVVIVEERTARLSEDLNEIKDLVKESAEHQQKTADRIEAKLDNVISRILVASGHFDGETN